MPLCTLHLISLYQDTKYPIPGFLEALSRSDITPLVVSRVIRWIILPTKLSTDALLAQNTRWDLLLILSSTSPLPQSVLKLVQNQWSVTAGIPKRLLQDFESKNRQFLHPPHGSIPKLSGALEQPLTAESAQGLELSAELRSWIQRFSTSGPEGKGAVSMLNLLSFKDGMKPSYLEYGKAFAESIGSKRGGNAKIVGTVININGKEKKEGDGDWDEIALAHYPSISHFADMLASEDYQKVNHQHRIPALRDTFILCTSEIGIEDLLGKHVKDSSRL
ncbi:hypothetical protein BU24DRAFT_253287 [Aaosphaeria arxii CBS 175.79]|uniref:DUF1330 domain-containing protein n=1 Tax=Aaosphaeria arxii CBS 175.79 TaxID=1450172 RepID=A0A6A5XHD4_9PLEO|nr:uncharacterized protein BU24DRAFT_253287 [Aaosphaeria arxii CBS 175.79]KAF2012512.1 hypothetical protein BU24DRAFT_253287 [Aaosphaeria arxii CBS 175.79]